MVGRLEILHTLACSVLQMMTSGEDLLGISRMPLLQGRRTCDLTIRRAHLALAQHQVILQRSLSLTTYCKPDP
jgi:hypothetical protein